MEERKWKAINFQKLKHNQALTLLSINKYQAQCLLPVKGLLIINY